MFCLLFIITQTNELIFNRKNKIIGFKPDIACFGGKVSLSATGTFFGKLSKVIQKISKETRNQVDNTHKRNVANALYDRNYFHCR